MPPIGDYGLIGGIAAVCSYLLAFPCGGSRPGSRSSPMPGERRLHQQPIPYGGGLAMFIAFFAAIIVADHVAEPARKLSRAPRSRSVWCSERR